MSGPLKIIGDQLRSNPDRQVPQEKIPLDVSEIINRDNVFIMV